MSEKRLVRMIGVVDGTRGRLEPPMEVELPERDARPLVECGAAVYCDPFVPGVEDVSELLVDGACEHPEEKRRKASRMGALGAWVCECGFDSEAGE